MRSVNQVYERLKTQMSPLPTFSKEKGEDRYRSQIDRRGCSFCVCVPRACFWHFTLSSASLYYALCVVHFCQCPSYQNSSLIRRKPQPRLAQTPRTATRRVLFLRNCWHSRTSQASKTAPQNRFSHLRAWLDDTSLERVHTHARWHTDHLFRKNAWGDRLYKLYLVLQFSCDCFWS